MSGIKKGIDDLKSRPVFRTLMFFVVIICTASLLIMIGTRSDAVTKARRLQAGVVAADEISVSFENVGGRLVKRRVNESDTVKKGDLLLEINAEDIELAVASLKAQLRNIDAQLDAQTTSLKNSRDRVRTSEISLWREIEELYASFQGAEAELTRAQAQYKRYENLDKAAAVSKSSYDEARSVYLQDLAQVTSIKKSLAKLTLGATDEQLQRLKRDHDASGMTLSSVIQQKVDTENMENELRALRAQHDSLQAQLQQQELNLKRTKLYAPEDGRVLEIMYDEGEMVAASSPAVVIESNRKYFDVYISEKAAAHYHAGGRIEGYAPALARSVGGDIRFVLAAPSFADLRMTREQGQADLTSFKMRVYTDQDPQLLRGMTVELANDYD